MQEGLGVPRELVVEDGLAYVVDEGTDRLQIFDVSDPANMTPLDFDQSGLSRPVRLDVDAEAGLAAVVDVGSRSVSLFDVSDPQAIVLRTAFTGEEFVSAPLDVDLQGEFLYIADWRLGRLQILQIVPDTP